MYVALSQAVSAFQAVSGLSWLPFEQPVAVLALSLASFLIAPLLVERVGLPGIVGVVLAGTALGPNGLGVLAHSDAIVLLGNAGLVYLLFTVGLELDLRRFFNAPEDAAFFGVTSFFLPFAVGTAVCIVALGFDVWAAMLLSAVFASHTLLAYPIVNRLDVTKNPAVTAVFGGILFTDTSALVILALVLGAIDGGLTPILLGEVAVGLFVLFGGLWVVIPPLTRWFFRNTSQESYFEFLFVAALIFGAASLAEALGLAAILGAFVAGLAINRQITRGGTLMNRIEFVGNAFFIPFFLLHVGMLVNPGVVLEGTRTLGIAGVILGTMFVTKVAAAGGVAAVKGYDANELGVLVGLSVGQAAAALAITLLGFEAGIFSTAVLNAVVLMILVSAIVSPWLTERYGRRLATEGTTKSDLEEPYDPRVLLPLSRTAELQRRLLELAFALKDDPAATPVHLLTVLPPGASDADLEAAEADLEVAAEHGGAAEVPVETETRINHNVASGIARASVETRADIILMGWDATRTLGGRLFGTVIDRVRRRTTDPVLVSRLGIPVNTTRRILLVLPPGIGHHEGFAESIHLVKRLAENLGVGVEAIAVGDRPPARKHERLLELIPPEMEVPVTVVDDWDGLWERLSEAESDDLVVPLKPREGGVGWSSRLRRLPVELSDVPPEAFVVVTPRQGDPAYTSRFFRID
ncbi:cation:proton antiporter [Natronomonas gomsonensis]|uniref:cation:proton antiporter n=1 Tax=Natronomonas gomsonensis TaxID=1046043 RepID=UPI0015BA1A18|nr:cation:proton antiporter [Natronomonas gomsonensis]